MRPVAAARDVELVPTSDVEKNSLDLDTIAEADHWRNFDESNEDGKLYHLTLHYPGKDEATALLRLIGLGLATNNTVKMI